MKKILVLLLSVVMVLNLCSCGKDEPKASDSAENTVVEAEDVAKTDDNVEAEDVASKADDGEENDQKPEEQTEETNEVINESPAVEESISVEELSYKYTDCIDDLVKDCDTLDELAFATVDVNNDGIKELLYAESSVNAAGVYVCFYKEGQIITTGPFGCYGGIKYAPMEGKIISVMDNMDYMSYELIGFDDKFASDTEQKFEIEPGSDEGSYVYFLDDEEVTESEYSKAFDRLKSMDVRSLDYYDMFMYEWTTADSDVIAKHFVDLLEGDDPSSEYHMIIPMEEKAKLIGTWEMYSSEVEGDISYAKDGSVSGKITVHEDYSVDFDYGRHKMSGMRMDFCNGSFNDYADNTDWYVIIDAYEEDGTTIYMNVSEDDRLTVNTIGEGETLISVWYIYNRVN